MASPKKLAGYELIERLAVGGMAEIFLARSRSIQGFEKEYVLKLIHPKNSGDADFLRMLVDEAKLTAQLHHTNIAQVIDLGKHEDQYFIVMEYIRGKDLFQILNQAYDMRIPVPLDVCAWVIKESLAGLYYAHTKYDQTTGKPLNLVHRDISPQNIILGWQGEVKVLDFGVAKAAQAARPETQAGIIKGKFRYMSPEQAWGEKLDGRSDMFSAALCLYEMSTSSMAYEDEQDMRKMLIRMREAKFKPPRSLRPDMDPQFEEILMKGLQRRRQDRFEDCEAFEAALTRYLYQRTPDFTRANVRAFLSQVFPDEAPYAQSAMRTAPVATSVASNGAAPKAAAPKAAAPGPIMAPVLTSTSEIIHEADLSRERTDQMPVLEEVTDDHTVRRSIAGKISAPAEDEFEGGATELFSHKHPQPEPPTEAMKRPMPALDATSAMPRRTQEELRKSSFIPTKTPTKPIRPQPIPTSWLPKEVPVRDTVAPGTLSPFASHDDQPRNRAAELFAEVHRVINGRGTPAENKRYGILGLSLFAMLILSILLLAILA